MQMAKRATAIILAVALVLQLSACGFMDTVSKAGGTISKGASKAKDAVVSWCDNIDLSRFEKGWDSVVDFMGSSYASTAAVSSEYLSNIGKEISNLKLSMNEAYGSARGLAQEAGFAAEKWVAGTLNIDAAAKGSAARASTPQSTDFASVDVETTWGEDASLKFYADGSESAKAQATSAFEEYHKSYNNEVKRTTGDAKSFRDYLKDRGYDPDNQDEILASMYEGQTRIIPTDQIAEATKYLQGRINKLSAIDGDAASARTKAYQETLASLKDRLESPDGAQSRPVTNDEMKAMTELAVEGKFKPEQFGISVIKMMDPKLVLKQAMGTGLEVGALKAIFTVAPDLVSIIIEAAKNQNVNKEEIEEVGVEGVIAMSEGFVEGSVSRVVVELCNSGAFGEVLKSAPPDVIGALVLLTIEGIIAGFGLARGEITTEEYGNLMADKSMITLLAIPATKVALIALPATKLGIILGCFAGGMIACAGYLAVKDVVLEFVDGGGFEAVVPDGVGEKVEAVNAKISDLNLNEQVSKLKKYTVTTAKNGYITVKSIIT